MFEVPALLILIPGLPLAAAAVTAALGPRWLGRRSHLPTVCALGLSLAASLLLVGQVAQKAAIEPADRVGFERTTTLWRWASIDADPTTTEPRSSGSGPSATAPSRSRLGLLGLALPVATQPARFTVDVTLRADPLTAIMLATVTLVSLLVAVYSIGYMHGDRGYWRFFSYLSLFVFSMTMLVSVSNFVMLYVFWEAVGLCSYLMIGFWYERPAAAAAGVKAFLVNRVGDFGFALGLFLLWTVYGTLDFHDTMVGGRVAHVGILGQTMLSHPTMYVAGGLATAICLLLFLGACGKSAQFPLHVWLPDAMEGPTPVSALIHAATMGTAGVYLVARCTPLFAASPDARAVVACVGGFTALMAALIALAQTDLKRILAYSTVSQLGYMFLGLGTGTILGVTAGMFHLFTHAFFKALLFLAAGSVMHAMAGVIDVREFGGLRRRLPVTYWTFLAGGLALAGVFPLSGFWSKDAILVAVGGHAAVAPWPALYHLLLVGGLVTAGLTAFYIARALLLAFHGQERIPAKAVAHAHESPRVMTGPLVILAVAAIAVGGWFEWTHGFARFLHETPSIAFLDEAAHAPLPHGRGSVLEDHSGHLAIAALSTAMALGGIGLAVAFYSGRRRAIARVVRAVDAVGLYRLVRGKFFFDEIYAVLFVRPLVLLARSCSVFDRLGIDGLIDFIGGLPGRVGKTLRPLQAGVVSYYALAMVVGVLILMGVLMM